MTFIYYHFTHCMAHLFIIATVAPLINLFCRAATALMAVCQRYICANCYKFTQKYLGTKTHLFPNYNTNKIPRMTEIWKQKLKLFIVIIALQIRLKLWIQDARNMRKKIIQKLALDLYWFSLRSTFVKNFTIFMFQKKCIFFPIKNILNISKKDREVPQQSTLCTFIYNPY